MEKLKEYLQSLSLSGWELIKYSDCEITANDKSFVTSKCTFELRNKTLGVQVFKIPHDSKSLEIFNLVVDIYGHQETLNAIILHSK